MRHLYFPVFFVLVVLALLYEELYVLLRGEHPVLFELEERLEELNE